MKNDAVQLGIPKNHECFNTFNIKDSRPIVFCTVHAGQNKLTNITIKSILRFHPNAKVFVIDVTQENGWLNERFSPIDEDVIGNLEVLKGRTREDIHLQDVDISQWQIDETTRNIIGADSVPQLLNGDSHHSCNIQFAIDTIGENFILIDNDAPLVRKIDFFDSGTTIVSDVEASKTGTVVKRMFSDVVYRFMPYVQYLNVSEMKKHGLNYWGQNEILRNKECTFFINTSWGTGIYAPTGSYIFNQAILTNSQFHRISHSEYIDHFKSGTWESDGKKKKAFFLKYLHLFSNKEAFGNFN